MEGVRRVSLLIVGSVAFDTVKTARHAAEEVLGGSATYAAYAAALNRAGEIAGFDPDEASTVRAAASLQCPLVLVHGWWDIVVPYQHSQAILHAARPPKKLIRQVLQGHGADFRREKWLVRQIESLVKTARAMSV